MSEFLWQSYHRLIADVNTQYHRYLYEKLNLETRLLGIIGPRGVGKTTLMLQYIKEHLYENDSAFYFSADNTFFNETSILNFINQLYLEHNIHIFFIDEIHKYANWNQELKNIYDSFPKIKIVFSGSSSIDLITGTYDLSRRAKLLHMPGMSFREYLNIATGHQFPAISFETLLQDHKKLTMQFSQVATLSRYFEDYLAFGYYPIVFESRDNLYPALSNVIDKTIYEDIANFYSLKTTNLTHFKRIINFLAGIPPGTVSTNNIAKHLGIDNKTADHYLEILHRTGMVRMLYPVAQGNQLLTKPSNIYLDNTTLLSTINTLLSTPLNKGTERELAMLQFIMGAGLSIHYPKVGDFQINDVIFEVGGNNKTWKQLQNYQGKKFLVKDKLLQSYGEVIPLYLFGFLY